MLIAVTAQSVPIPMKKEVVSTTAKLVSRKRSSAEFLSDFLSPCKKEMKIEENKEAAKACELQPPVESPPAPVKDAKTDVRPARRSLRLSEKTTTPDRETGYTRKLFKTPIELLDYVMSLKY